MRDALALIQAEAAQSISEMNTQSGGSFIPETESQLKLALETLDKMQMIRDAMNEITADG